MVPTRLKGITKNVETKKLEGATISTASMSDITFLLLIFFLVATVIEVDTGIGLNLPEYK